MKVWQILNSVLSPVLATTVDLFEKLSELRVWSDGVSVRVLSLANEMPAAVVGTVVGAICILGVLNIALLALWLRARRRPVSLAELDVPIIPVAADQEEDSDSKLVGVPIQTLVGEVIFPNSHAVGRVGDNLSAIYFTRQGYTKKKSKTSMVHGIDGVYVRSSSQYSSQRQVLVVENKINTSGYKRHQLSLEGIQQRCQRMLKAEDAELQETAELILGAMSESSSDRLVRMVVRHDLRIGKSTRFLVDELGNTSDKHGEWQNERDMSKVLKNAVNKGRAWTAQHAAGAQIKDVK
jgi:hypothetical protein